MEKPCPICGVPFEESRMDEHVSTAHAASTEPEIAEAKAHASHRCIKCGAELPSPEALSNHLLVSHKM